MSASRCGPTVAEFARVQPERFVTEPGPTVGNQDAYPAETPSHLLGGNPIKAGLKNMNPRTFRGFDLDAAGIGRYLILSIPVGPLPQGMLSLGGFFFCAGSLV